MGSQIIKNQVVGGQLIKKVLIFKQTGKVANCEVCDESNLATKIATLVKDGYIIRYGPGRGQLEDVMNSVSKLDGYLQCALKEAGLLDGVFK